MFCIVVSLYKKHSYYIQDHNLMSKDKITQLLNDSSKTALASAPVIPVLYLLGVGLLPEFPVSIYSCTLRQFPLPFCTLTQIVLLTP